MMNPHDFAYPFMVNPFVEVAVQLKDRINANVIVLDRIDNGRRG